MPRGAFTDCWKKIIFCFFSGFWAKTFRFFVSSLFGMVVKTLFYVSRKLSEENELFRKKRVFCFFFRIFSGSFSDFWCNLSRHGFQKCILHVHKKISRRSLLWNHIICWYFRVLSSNFSGFWWKKHKKCCQNCILIVQRNILGLGKLFRTMWKYGFFRFPSKSTSLFHGKLFRQVFYNCFLLVPENFRWRNWIISKGYFFWCSLSYFEPKPIRLLAKNCLPSCWNSILRVPTEVLK